MDDILGFFYEILPPWLVTGFCVAVGLAAGIGGVVWRSHEKQQLQICNSGAGRVDQVFNGAAHVSCGAASLLSIVALLLAIVGFVIAGIFLIVFWVLGAKGKLLDIDAA